MVPLIFASVAPSLLEAESQKTNHFEKPHLMEHNNFDPTCVFECLFVLPGPSFGNAYLVANLVELECCRTPELRQS